MQKIIPHLWFDKNAEEASQFYTSVFEDGRLGEVTRFVEAGKDIHGMEPGSVMTVGFEIEGFQFLALNGGPLFSFTPAISFMVHCKDEREVDRLWGQLAEDGMALMPLDSYPFSPRYGWVQDKFGVSWQLIYRNDSPAGEQKIVPSLMYVGDQAGRAEEAMELYTSIFPDGSIGHVARYGAENAPDREGTVMYADFTLAGQDFAAMDSAQAHAFTFNEAISLLVLCEDQSEIDSYWEKLSDDPEAEQCGWLKDRFGVSWQIAPVALGSMLKQGDGAQVERVTAAFMSMKKLDIAALEQAYRVE